MRILVTGGAGFIGSHIAAAYLAEGHQVAVVDALAGGGGNRTPRGATFYQEDIRRPALAEVFRKERPEVVSHHAAQANLRRSIEDPVADGETNVLGTLRVLDLAARFGVKQVIFSSTGGALYGEPRSLPVGEDDPVLPMAPYGFHKYLAEHYVGYFRRVHGLGAVVFRYANVYGPRQDPSTEAGVISIFAEAILGGRPPVIFGDGTQTRDFVYVGDVAEANVRALGRSIEPPIHIATGIETSVNDLYARLRALTRSTVDAVHGPPIPGEVHRICLGIGRAKDLLGWRPRTPLEEGLRRTVEWFKTGRGAPA
ncbi:MAG: UDP-glucose 4-epimerase [Armatimonadetes bacterium 13_1_40CM_3_65_7]|nr:MAG: UDP-glucose 4-epimerase [Armatimonadetes bacterium 13_1_40CM_3_65_7]